MNSWLILVSVRGLEPLWYGNIPGTNRAEAKTNARAFVARHLTDDAKIVQIARGHIDIKFAGPVTDFEET